MRCDRASALHSIDIQRVRHGARSSARQRQGERSALFRRSQDRGKNAEANHDCCRLDALFVADRHTLNV